MRRTAEHALPHDRAGGLPAPDARALAMRGVHRAIGELRRGTPVLLLGDGDGLLVAAAETVSAMGLAELAAASHGRAALLLAPVRAAALLSRPLEAEAGPVALRLPPGLLEPGLLRRLADPTAERLLPEHPERLPAHPLGAAAVALAKLARLLPALVAAPLRVDGSLPGRASGIAPGRADDAAQCRAESATWPPADGTVPGRTSATPTSGTVPATPPALLCVPAADVLAYPGAAALSLRRVAEAPVPLEDAADARVVAFRAADGGVEHIAILVGRPEALAAQGGAPLARVHSECFTGDLLGSMRCDCGPQLRGAIARMAAERAGVVLYLAQEGRGIGLVNKLRAYTLQDGGLDTLDANRALGYGADERGFLVAAEMLRELSIGRVRLLTNNPDKVGGLAACGVTVTERVPLRFAANGVNDGYLATKARRFGHLLG